MHYGGLGSVLEKFLTPGTDRHGGASEKRKPGPVWQKWASLNPSQEWGGFTVQVYSQALRFSGQREREKCVGADVRTAVTL